MQVEKVLPIEEKRVEVKLRAGGWIRLIALFYDLAVLAMFLFMFAGGTTLWMMISTDTPFIGNPELAREYIMEHEPHLFIINWIILGIVFLFYQYVYPTFKRQTFGMLFTDLTVVNEQCKEITKSQYIKRELLKLILFPTFFLAFGTEKRTLYEKYSNTYLLK
ncbi:RDD family protein [Bacillus suaedae]|uniref:RDD family protein n=1 Tax=Halalkalibacter suaedae TaxID=2822140 RepID=A0A940WQT0_9BACI|nr:RDD family protein [Bacillus suaedae]MBP3950810.1 RDD family protein [Bacillus suaedae]